MNEITLQLALQAAKGGAVINTVGSGATAQVSLDMAGEDMGADTLVAPASGSAWAAVDVGNVTGARLLYLASMEATDGTGHDVSVAVDDAGTKVEFALLKPKGRVCIPTSSTVYFRCTANYTARVFRAVCEQ